jgi:hypothetical protein
VSRGRSARRRRSGRKPAKEATPAKAGGLRRAAAGVVGVLAAFGILGAIGSKVVDETAPVVTEKLRGGPPLTVSVREDPQGGADGFGLAAPAGRGLRRALAGVRGCDGLFEAGKRAGAVDVGLLVEKVVLEGRTARGVTIVGMRARVLKRRPPLAAASISCQSAGAIGAAGMVFDLDEPRAVARGFADDSGTPGRPYFDRKVIEVAHHEIQPLDVRGVSSHAYVEWVIDADLLVDGKTKTMTIDDGGRPFRVTGPPPKFRYGRYFEWAWYVKRPFLYEGGVAAGSTPPNPRAVLDASPAAAGTHPCHGGEIRAGPSTTCPFAANVSEAYLEAGGIGEASVEAFSKATGQTVTMRCTGDSPHVCTGGRNAKVVFP